MFSPLKRMERTNKTNPENQTNGQNNDESYPITESNPLTHSFTLEERTEEPVDPQGLPFDEGQAKRGGVRSGILTSVDFTQEGYDGDDEAASHD